MRSEEDRRLNPWKIQKRVHTKPCSSNAAYFRKRGGGVVKTKAYTDYEKALTTAFDSDSIESTEVMYTLYYKFGFARRTSDVDNPIKPTTDILANIFGFNDRQIYKVTAEKYVGGGEWVEITITEYFRKDT